MWAGTSWGRDRANWVGQSLDEPPHKAEIHREGAAPAMGGLNLQIAQHFPCSASGDPSNVGHCFFFLKKDLKKWVSLYSGIRERDREEGEEEIVETMG